MPGPSSMALACRCGVVLSLVAHHSTSAFQPIPSTAIVVHVSLGNRQRRSSIGSRSTPRQCVKSVKTGEDHVHPVRDGFAPNKRIYSKLPRLYVGINNDPGRAILCEGARIQLSADQSHYLSTVMRIFGKGKKNKTRGGDGDENLSQCVRLFDGVNGEWLARVSFVENDSVGPDDGRRKNRRQKRGAPSNLSAECLLQLRQQQQQRHGNEEALPWVLFAPIKKHRAKFLIEKCTELGAGKFVPIITDRTDPGAVSGCIGVHQSTDALEKLAVQALEASEQCERLSVPVVSANFASSFIWTDGIREEKTATLYDISTLLEKWFECHNDDEAISTKRRLLICRERMPGNGMLSRLGQNDGDSGTYKKNSVAFLVGPEGGWSEAEEQLFEQYEARCPVMIQSVSLGDFVLRAETAAMTCIAAWNLSQDKQYES